METPKSLPRCDVFLSHLGRPGGRRVADPVRRFAVRPVRQEGRGGLAVAALRGEAQGGPSAWGNMGRSEKIVGT